MRRVDWNQSLARTALVSAFYFGLLETQFIGIQNDVCGRLSDIEIDFHDPLISKASTKLQVEKGYSIVYRSDTIYFLEQGILQVLGTELNLSGRTSLSDAYILTPFDDLCNPASKT